MTGEGFLQDEKTRDRKIGHKRRRKREKTSIKNKYRLDLHRKLQEKESRTRGRKVKEHKRRRKRGKTSRKNGSRLELKENFKEQKESRKETQEENSTKRK